MAHATVLTFHMSDDIRRALVFLRSRGINPKHKWVESVIMSGVRSPEEVMERFLDTDISETADCDAENQLSMNFMKPEFVLESPVTLQVNEVVDVSLPESDRLAMKQSDSPTLKLLLSNGDTIYAVAQRPIPGIAVGCPGAKIQIRADTVMRYGVFVLDDENTLVLGGQSPAILAMIADKKKQKPVGFREAIEQSLHLVKDGFSPDLGVRVHLPELPHA